ncbi:MAG TPA: helix-turn-helix transcriptional regulator, partial [Clostridiales bacterium]|nr:helix-turn-helix transcriptional regulator [Clostridiales bacterium]
SFKNILMNYNHAIGPLIGNRISILVTHDTIDEEDSNNVAELLIKTFNEKHITVTIGIGSITSIASIYSSFLESLTALSYCNPNKHMHVNDTTDLRKDLNFDYEDTEKHLLDAIRQKKVEAYDYFGILMNCIAPFNDLAKRNFIVEILILSAHVMRIDNPESMKRFNPLGKTKELMECKGSELIEWAFKQFIYITAIVKPQNSIDYSNKIVRLTKEYLEAHYTEDISLEDVATQVNVSPQYFSKLIKKNTGFNFIDWLSMMRVKKAKELFNSSNLSIKEVCYMIGYKDPNYFSRIFKKRVGITPSEYIKNINFKISDD